MSEYESNCRLVATGFKNGREVVLYEEYLLDDDDLESIRDEVNNLRELAAAIYKNESTGYITIGDIVIKVSAWDALKFSVIEAAV